MACLVQFFLRWNLKKPAYIIFTVSYFKGPFILTIRNHFSIRFLCTNLVKGSPVVHRENLKHVKMLTKFGRTTDNRPYLNLRFRWAENITFCETCWNNFDIKQVLAADQILWKRIYHRTDFTPNDRLWSDMWYVVS